jgi:hypothetical protein
MGTVVEIDAPDRSIRGSKNSPVPSPCAPGTAKHVLPE